MTWLAHKVLRARGWRFEGSIPDLPKMIVLGAPHTSNWDFIVFLAAVHAYRIKVKYMGKEGLFRWPFGYFFRALGGIPVSQGKPGGVVGQVVRAFGEYDRMILVIAPEGTRSAAPKWRSGFLHIAREAGVPVVPVSIDAPARVVEAGPALDVSNVADFMDEVRAFYAGKAGLRPEGMGPIRVAEED